MPFAKTALAGVLLPLAVLPVENVFGAGWCPGIERGESCGPEYELGAEVLELHLQKGEQPRDSIWGAGLIETVLEDVDVFVAGGGSAGVSAAIAAARSGATTVLVNSRCALVCVRVLCVRCCVWILQLHIFEYCRNEYCCGVSVHRTQYVAASGNSPVLGGNSGSEVRLSMVGACGPRAGQANADQMECREGGIVEEYQLDNTVNNPHLVPELFSLELLTLVKAEPKLTLFQNTYFVGATIDNSTRVDGNIVCAATLCRSTVFSAFCGLKVTNFFCFYVGRLLSGPNNCGGRVREPRFPTSVPHQGENLH